MRLLTASSAAGLFAGFLCRVVWCRSEEVLDVPDSELLLADVEDTTLSVSNMMPPLVAQASSSKKAKPLYIVVGR
jgi:hypothetical protein